MHIVYNNRNNSTLLLGGMTIQTHPRCLLMQSVTDTKLKTLSQAYAKKLEKTLQKLVLLTVGRTHLVKLNNFYCNVLAI